MSDDVIGTITGTATFEKVSLREYEEDDEQVEVVGEYHGDQTIYRTERHRVYIDGLQLADIEGEMAVTPTEGDYVWVEASKDELHITNKQSDE